MFDDEILSKEAALLYINVDGFYPVNNSLFHWRAIKQDKNGQPVKIEIELDNEFPNSPPSVSIHYPGAKIPLLTRKLTRWRSDYHLFQVAIEAISQAKLMVQPVIALSGNSRASTQPESLNIKKIDKRADYYNRQLKLLEIILADRLAENQLLKEQNLENRKISKENIAQIAKTTLFNMEIETSTLEENFEKGELTVHDFCKKFLNLRERYLTLQLAIV